MYVYDSPNCIALISDSYIYLTFKCDISGSVLLEITFKLKVKLTSKAIFLKLVLIDAVHRSTQVSICRACQDASIHTKGLLGRGIRPFWGQHGRCTNVESWQARSGFGPAIRVHKEPTSKAVSGSERATFPLYSQPWELIPWACSFELFLQEIIIKIKWNCVSNIVPKNSNFL
jgi:hypothetical protein